MNTQKKQMLACEGNKMNREKQKIIELYRQEKLTIRNAADLLGIDYWQMQELLELAGIPIANLTETQINERKINSL